jgi:hypothetical protein
LEASIPKVIGSIPTVARHIFSLRQWRNGGRGPLVIFGVGAPVYCCHCLTEILYWYWIFIECSGKFRVYNNNSLQHT